MSKIQNESKSQPLMYVANSIIIVISMSKIQNESKSQLKEPTPLSYANCNQYVKDTKRKQITTDTIKLANAPAL